MLRPADIHGRSGRSGPLQSRNANHRIPNNGKSRPSHRAANIHSLMRSGHTIHLGKRFDSMGSYPAVVMPQAMPLPL
jgi:hypothetical protein